MIDDIIKKLSLKYDLPTKVIKKVIESPFEFIRETISNIDMKKMTYDQIIKLKTNFLLSPLGVLHINQKKLYKIKEKLKQIKNEV